MMPLHRLILINWNDVKHSTEVNKRSLSFYQIILIKRFSPDGVRNFLSKLSAEKLSNARS